MVEVTLEITDKCDVPYPCVYCSTDASKEGTQILDIGDISDFLHKIVETQKITRINISGGEPLSHPDFYKILKHCEDFTSNVWVYTNALRQIKFNADVMSEITVEANVCIIAGRSTYIPKNVDKINLLKLVSQGRGKNVTQPEISVSRNFYDTGQCLACDHILLQADGQVAEAPCKKKYGEKE